MTIPTFTAPALDRFDRVDTPYTPIVPRHYPGINTRDDGTGADGDGMYGTMQRACPGGRTKLRIILSDNIYVVRVTQLFTLFIVNAP